MSYLMLMENYKASEEELEEEFDSSYVPLMTGLQSLDNGNLINSILKLDYSTRVSYYPKKDEIRDIVSKWKISEDLCVNTSNNEENFNCICGKKHLYNLHLFYHHNVTGTIIIGTKCVEKMGRLIKLCHEHTDLLAKIERIMEMFGFEERKKLYRRCWSCREHKIKKNYEYDLYWNKFFCRGCLIVDSGEEYLKCKCCRKKIKIEKQYYPNGRGKTESPYKLLCKTCWRESMEHTRRIEQKPMRNFEFDIL